MKKRIVFLIIILFSFACSDDNNTPDPIPVGWQIIDNPNGYDSLTDIEFCNDDFGVICGSCGTILKTENGGLDWQILNPAVISSSLMKVFVLNENEFYVSRNGLYKTNNGGRTFIEIGDLSSFGATIFEIHFFDSDNGLIYKSGRVFKTNDGGLNWEEVYRGGFNKMQFVSNNIGYLAGGASWDGMSYGELHKTIDGGNTWINLGMSEEVYSWEIMAMNFISEDTGFIANFNREIYITQDGGITWDKRCDKLPHYIYDVVFLSKDEGYGAGYWGILKTTDGGITWTWDYENESFVLVSIAKTPDNTIIAVGNGGVILRKE